MRMPSPLTFVRRHAGLLAVLFLLVAGYFAAVGWVARALRTDLAHTVQLAPAVADHQHRRD